MRWIAAFLLCLSTSMLRAEPVDFNREIRPILSENCFHCHGPDEAGRKAKLRLDTREGAFRVKNEVPVLVAGKSGESELFKRLVTDNPRELMPPAKSKKSLKPEQIALIKRWIDEGAEWRQHWAFEAVKPAPLPVVKGWGKNEIDAFIFDKLKKETLKPSPEASREILLRRVSLDLTGLPPTPEEVAEFVKDKRTDAYERAVDRLLQSPRYGERMAWDWLDAARYADSNGYQGDGDRTMWPWRDWVVNAFNDNMSYDRFTVLQLAGDLLPKPTRDEKLATAFNRNHMINGEGGRIAEENRIEYIVDQTDTVATIWLGVTLGCARCHDHKYDPFTMKDYYGLFAYFNQTPVGGGGGNGKTPPVLDFATKEQTAKAAKIKAEFDALAGKVGDVEKKLRDDSMVKKDDVLVSSFPTNIESGLRKGAAGRTDQNSEELIAFFKAKEPEYVKDLTVLLKLKKERDAVNQSLVQVMVMEDQPKKRDTFLLLRGAYDKPGAKVDMGVPAVLPPLPKDAPSNRLALAQWLVDPNHPLTARVTVNRLWQTFFGTGLVKSVEEFGVQGEQPSHPELLDWLADDFVKHGWDVKRLVKQMVTSAAYRQSSKVTPALLERDPENRLLARGPRQRMPSWMLRDQALFLGGLLNEKIGGPPVRPYQPAGIWEEATFGNKRYTQDKGDAIYRRSLYVFWRRIVGPTMFFDTASRQVCAVKGVRTNTPLHALTTLNDVTYVEAARHLAQRALEKKDLSTADRIGWIFTAATSRHAKPEEMKILVGSFERMQSSFAQDKDGAEKLLKVGDNPRNAAIPAVDHAALTSLCTLILNLDETLTKQ